MQSRTASPAFRSSPGAQVLVACVVVAVTIGPLGALGGAALSVFVGDRAGQEFVSLIATGLFGAQLSMLVIWLCLMSTSLYWCLVAIGAFAVLLLSLVPASGNAPSGSILAAGALMATLPLAAMNLVGFRVVPSEANLANAEREPPRFTLRSLFFWTFIAAVILALFHSLPTAVFRRWEFLLSLMAISAIAVATLWAVLRPGPVWLRLACAPPAVLLLAVFGTQKPLGWGDPAVPRLLAMGVVYTLTLAGLLAIYRHAGMRLVHKTAGGWLVR